MLAHPQHHLGNQAGGNEQRGGLEDLQRFAGQLILYAQQRPTQHQGQSVLHHTGQMYEAITRAAALVAPEGHLVIALYGKTRYCGVWTRIKRWYVQADDASKAWAERLYIRLFGAYLLLRGKTLKQHIAKYKNKRGMDFYHDVRDWIGGYPYESIAPEPLKRY